MGWASNYIQLLRNGQTIKFRPRGNSMTGRIDNGALVTVAPINDVNLLQDGDVVLCTVHGNQYLHLIKAIKDQRFLIGNNHGRINGWCGINQIHGICIAVEP